MRVRFRFSKIGKIRFTSHRDVARIWERAMRRAGLPVALTEGFSPRPKVHFGLALSTGYESLGEYIDVDLREGETGWIDLVALPRQLTEMLPTGLTVEVASVIDRREPSLQQAVTSCTWSIRLPGVDAAEVRAQAERLLGAERLEVTRERKGQAVTDDIRPALLAIDVQPAHGEPADDDTPLPLEPVTEPGARPPGSVTGSGAELLVELGTQPRSVRPAELLGAFDPPMPDAITFGGRVCRLHQWITVDGAKREPLAPPTATSAAHAAERAS